jgi:hypothetical protein
MTYLWWQALSFLGTERKTRGGVVLVLFWIERSPGLLGGGYIYIYIYLYIVLLFKNIDTYVN